VGVTHAYATEMKSSLGAFLEEFSKKNCLEDISVRNLICFK